MSYCLVRVFCINCVFDKRNSHAEDWPESQTEVIVRGIVPGLVA